MTNIRNKQRPFRMLKYLYENTDENHPVSTPELVKIFQAEDAHASRKTVKDDIDVLIGEGFDIVTVRSTQNSFFLANRKFEIPEIKLLIDAVSSSRFISREKSAVLIEKLTGMVSKAQAEKIRRHLYTADRVKADNRQIYYTVDAITDAINEGKKICFQYFEYSGDKEKRLRRSGAKYYVSPYALVWDDNHYYMLGFSDDRHRLVNYRVDRMCNTGMTEEAAVPMPEGFDMEEYVQHQFRMFAGEEVEVVLECRNDMMKYIVDQFGEDVETWPASETTFFAKVSVADSPTFYGWVFPFEGKVKIAEPQEIRDKYRAMVMAAAQEPQQ
ncbi:MAG: WYL domain-containing protein [Lachnospiraceae bacterium]|nr:WYL domain-containing protein [Lachnospiraceae bacterium]